VQLLLERSAAGNARFEIVLASVGNEVDLMLLYMALSLV
jgi:hypothetical protein